MHCKILILSAQDDKTAPSHPLCLAQSRTPVIISGCSSYPGSSLLPNTPKRSCRKFSVKNESLTLSGLDNRLDQEAPRRAHCHNGLGSCSGPNQSLKCLEDSDLRRLKRASIYWCNYSHMNKTRLTPSLFKFYVNPSWWQHKSDYRSHWFRKRGVMYLKQSFLKWFSLYLVFFSAASCLHHQWRGPNEGMHMNESLMVACSNS